MNFFKYIFNGVIFIFNSNVFKKNLYIGNCFLNEIYINFMWKLCDFFNLKFV